MYFPVITHHQTKVVQTTKFAILVIEKNFQSPFGSSIASKYTDIQLWDTCVRLVFISSANFAIQQKTAEIQLCN